MPSQYNLRIVIPAHNEAQRISPCLTDYCEAFASTARIVVVCNGCTDDTFEVVRRECSRFPNLQVINIPARVGKGGAVRAGLKSGDEPFVGFVDADNSFSAAEYAKIFGALQESQADGAIASRAVAGSSVSPRPRFIRRSASRCFNFLVRLILGLPYRDTQCGAKIFKRDLVQRLDANLLISNFAFDIDLLYSAHRIKAAIIEVPIALNDVAGSTIRIVPASLRMFAALMRLRLEHSPIANVPYLEFLAASSIIESKRDAMILFLLDERARTLPACRAVCEALTADGASLCFPPTPKYGTFVGHLQTLLWYVFVSKRRYDALVEARDAFPSLIPLFSVKRVFLVGAGRARLSIAEAIYSLYRRCVRHEQWDESLRRALEHATYDNAAFEQIESRWYLNVAPQAYGDERQLIDLG